MTGYTSRRTKREERQPERDVKLGGAGGGRAKRFREERKRTG